MGINAANVLTALSIVSELAVGIVEVTKAIKSGMTPEQLEEFIAKQNDIQERLRESLSEEQSPNP